MSDMKHRDCNAGDNARRDAAAVEVKTAFLSEEVKRLLKMDELASTSAPPKLREHRIQQVWDEVRANDRLLAYLLDFRPGSLHPRQYFFTILSTLFPVEYRTYLERVVRESRDQHAEQRR